MSERPAPSYDPDKSLTETLADNGYGHRPGGTHGQRMVFDLATGAEVGAMYHTKCTDWLKDRVRAFQNRGVE